MCQEENVVAIARVKEGGKEGTFWYVINGEAQKAIISDKLEFNQAMKEVLNGTKIQELKVNPFDPNPRGTIIKINDHAFQYGVSEDNKYHYLHQQQRISFSGSVNTITF